MGKIALYLSGGGARGAYQAGCLKALYQILNCKTLPFKIISGVSIGSINAAILAEYADDFAAGIDKLDSLWSQIRSQDIFNSSNYHLSKSVLRNLSHLFIKQRKSGHLLDTSPLNTFISEHICFDKIKEQIAHHHLETLEVITHCYETQQTISFYQHHQESFNDWIYPRHISRRTEIKMEHILASSALPLFFPTIKINQQHYGDGSMGLVSPLRGALRREISKLLILGTRQPPKNGHFLETEHKDIGLAHILGNMLNGLFMDNLDRDIENVNRMNELAKELSIWKKYRAPWRPIQTFYIRPHSDLSKLAQSKYQTMPALMRMFLNLLGGQRHSGDLLSFLLFENDFTSELIALGQKDTLKQAHQIESFFK